MTKKVLIRNASQIVTPQGHSACFGKAMGDVKVYENTSIFIEDGIIKGIGDPAQWEKEVPRENQIDAAHKAVLPGFVDSHTHLVFGGYRPDEFLWRMGGMSYMDIMNRGGGIINTMKATREASEAELSDHAMDHLKKMLAMGVTTVEAKSGYGQDYDTEIKQLHVTRKLNASQPIELVSTFLGAHAVPPEYKGRSKAFLDFLLKEVMPVVKKENLAEFCDIFCEEGVFSVDESRQYLKKAREMGSSSRSTQMRSYPLAVRNLLVNLKPQVQIISFTRPMQASRPWLKMVSFRPFCRRPRSACVNLLPGLGR